MKQFVKNNGVLFLFFLSALLVIFISLNANQAMNKTFTMMEKAIQDHLLAAAVSASQYVSVEELDLYHTVKDTQRPEYAALRERLIDFAEQYHVLYVYYWRDYGDNTLRFIIDNDTDPETQVTPEDVFDIEEIALKALTGEPTTTDFRQYTPPWSGLLSAFAPVYDSSGKIYCIAGVDISDEAIIFQHDATVQRHIVQIIALVISIISSGIMFVLYRQKIKQLNIFNTRLRQLVEEEPQRAVTLHQTFGRYLSDDIVKSLLESPQGLALGGKKQTITILMTDIRGFTRMSEQMQVEDVVTMLNHYYGVMVDAIYKYNGTVIEIIGDAILAIFGAPVAYENHADSAIACAVEMQRSMELVNEWNILNNYPVLDMGIGINTGETIVGNIGSPKVMKYNVIGKTVNLASHIESYTTGGQVFVSEYSFNLVKTNLRVVQTFEVLPKGVQKPVKVYQIDAIGPPYNLELKVRELPLTYFEEPVPVSCFHITDKDVGDKKLDYYLSAVSAEQATIIAKEGGNAFEIFENIKLVNSNNAEVFAKIIRKTNEGLLIRFTTDAKAFIRGE
jgi:class 3 adenylate cyclase